MASLVEVSVGVTFIQIYQNILNNIMLISVSP